jgi:hypothetical protein
LKSILTEFCEKRGISDPIKASFGTYLRTIYAKNFSLSGEGETIHLMINKMSEEDLEKAWIEFIKELANWLTT